VVFMACVTQSLSNEIVMEIKTMHIVRALVMNCKTTLASQSEYSREQTPTMTRRGNLATSKAAVTPTIKDQHWLARFMRVFA